MTVVLVVGNAATLTAGDIVLRNRVTAAGHTVVVRDDADAELAADGYDGVVIAESVTGTTVGGKYATSPRPMIVCDHDLWVARGFATSSVNVAVGDTQWNVTPTAGLDAGLSGTVAVYAPASDQASVQLVTLGSGAVIPTRRTANTARSAYFAYPTGATMASGGAAPARRVAFGLLDRSAPNLTTSGQALLAAAIGWAFPTPPAEVLDIGSNPGQNHVALQLSRPADSTITTVGLAELEAGFAESPRFVTTADGQRVRFEATVAGPTTPGSASTRCELREVDASGANVAWNPRVGEHDLRGVTRITSLPPTRPEVVVCQTFSEGLSADLCSIRTQLVSGTVRLRFRFNGVSVTSPQIIAPYTTGTEFAWRTRIVGGVIEVYWSTGGTALPSTPQIVTAAIPAAATGCYFKAGLYNQSTTAQDAGTAVGASELRDLRITHVGATASPTAFFLAAA